MQIITPNKETYREETDSGTVKQDIEFGKL